MRLKNIKLAGFKSFVDPITIPFPANLTAIVGPNGCGKSNIIDAIRWVMGESSAKQLRGDSLDDVIFNGSTNRKPLGQASIELTFDNSDGTLTGQYAGFTEIGIRREITRDGQSSYFLNSTRCRRRDIIDIFLGTGLGPRSYAIIEQGMISRLIEAKPEDLRAYLEEAAGISKYKERRHETELRIKHTQENLARLNDIREELAKQLDHLQRQANAAERYKKLKEEERLLRAQILTLRWQSLQAQLEQQTQEIARHEAQLAEATAAQQQVIAELKHYREQQTLLAAQGNETQTQYYQLTNELSRHEQTIRHQHERCEQWRNELADLAQRKVMLQTQLAEVAQQIQGLTQEVNENEPQVAQAQEKATHSQQSFQQAEHMLHEWQAAWETFNREVAQSEQQVRVEQTRIQHHEQHIATVEERRQRLQQEHEQQTKTLQNDEHAAFEQRMSELQEQCSVCEQELQALLQAISAQRQHNQHIYGELDSAKSQVQTLQGKIASLTALQEAALGKQEETVVEWLKAQQLGDKERLAELLKVDAGWEQAMETVLEKYLQAVCVPELNSLAPHLAELPQGNLTFVAAQMQHHADSTQHKLTSTLLEKVRAPLPLAPLLKGIYVAENADEALALLAQLGEHESIITRDGLWFGNGWMLVTHKADTKTGVLKRERELNEFKQALIDFTGQVQEKQEALSNGQEQLKHLEENRETKQKQMAELLAMQAQVRADLQVHQAQLQQTSRRIQQVNHELQDCAQQVAADQQGLLAARQTLEQLSQSLQVQAAQREQLQQSKADYQATLDDARQRAHADREAAHQLALRIQAVKLQLEAGEQNHKQLERQLQQIDERQVFLQTAIQESDAPLLELKQQVQTLTEQRLVLEEALATNRAQMLELETNGQRLESQRQEIENNLQMVRSALEQARLAGQAHEVRKNTLQEQLGETGHTIETLLAELPAEAEEVVWDERLTQTVRRIDRLGPINLAAIDEYTTQAERKEYLDKQHIDVTEALTSLEDAIRTMDKETRTRFKETLDQVNANFQTIFPRLFGGGRASLELTEADLLEADISVMAQPPGKRNSTIHLLSGGEKALTAISLVFSMFQLNPAPFCMLDEVDAPLDDANVVRFCNLVKEMANTVQFIFISHNKLAIEMAQQLAGVTMHEAGVSRIVAVDVEEAISLATA